MREHLPDNSINLIVTSPPYNVVICYDTYNDLKPWKDYLNWVEVWMKECYRVLENDGRICVDIPLEIGQYLPEEAKRTKKHPQVDYVNILEKCGFTIFAQPVWTNTQKSKLTAWGSWLSASNPWIFCPFEVVIIAYKKQWNRKNKGESTIDNKEFIDAVSGIWKFSSNMKRDVCPVPFPEKLPMRCIQLLSYKNDTVMDPFMGNGTTGFACAKSNRNFIGFEISSIYFKYAGEQLNRMERGIFE